MAAKKVYTAPRNAFDIIPTDEDDQPLNGASRKASKPATQQAEKLLTKSYRFPVSHARRFAAWTAERGLTEQEATRLAQIMFMEQYNA